jgi:ElaB/YqjD/DUF883 family membrane-anchored ribosome-binding protein
VTDAAIAGVTREFHDFLADIEDLVKSTTSLTGADLAGATARLNARVAAAKESMRHAGGVAAERVRDAGRRTDGYVHRQPWQAMGIGAALGLLLGLVLARRG